MQLQHSNSKSNERKTSLAKYNQVSAAFKELNTFNSSTLRLSSSALAIKSKTGRSHYS